MIGRRRLVAASLAGACGAPVLHAAAPVAEVGIADYKYQPERVVVTAGSLVRWTNREKRTTHTVRFTGAEGLESERLFPGASWERRFDKPGLYPYTCGPHPEMKGLVEVTP